MPCSKRLPRTSRTLEFHTLSEGDQGDGVRELHRRLSILSVGTSYLDDAFTTKTRAAVEAFQRSRGLPLTGEVDQTTWDRLEEANWSLGDRLLYESSPLLRGDDVAELQVRLAQLGFNPGRIDGIFGPILTRALREFQENSGLETTGVLTRASLHELTRLQRHSERHLITEARDSEISGGASNEVVIWGEGTDLDDLTDEIARTCTTHRIHGNDPLIVAHFANTMNASLVLSLAKIPLANSIHLHYWAGYETYSRRGEQLASAVAARLSSSAHSPRVEVTGMALPILRETRMTTLHVEVGELSDLARHDTIFAISAGIHELIHNSEKK